MQSTLLYFTLPMDIKGQFIADWGSVAYMFFLIPTTRVKPGESELLVSKWDKLYNTVTHLYSYSTIMKKTPLALLWGIQCYIISLFLHCNIYKCSFLIIVTAVNIMHQLGSLDTMPCLGSTFSVNPPVPQMVDLTIKNT